ncbi:putative tubulin polyglutamylase ttll2 [Rhizophlyctis rosea]|nr:putative tubulin polyglutamylase ttll2 [Rhizophlyctis rosea]
MPSTITLPLLLPSQSYITRSPLRSPSHSPRSKPSTPVKLESRPNFSKTHLELAGPPPSPSNIDETDPDEFPPEDSRDIEASSDADEDLEDVATATASDSEADQETIDRLWRQRSIPSLAPAYSDNAPVRTSILYYRLAEAGPSLIREVMESQGWREYIEDESPYWNLWWKGTKFRRCDYEECKSWQRLNHFPKTAVITRKDKLFRLLRTMRGIYGSSYDFFPQTFSLPTEYVKFVKIYAEEEEQGRKTPWICKPADQSRGRGIFVFQNLHELRYDCHYVLVKSYRPLVVYIYEKAIVRFATSKYTLTDLANPYAHLTNTSINKKSPTFDDAKEGVGAGCRWGIEKLRSYFEERGWDWERIWRKIQGIIILTLLPVSSEIPANVEGCFELYGFDVLVDEQMRPWLLEVNLSPALSVDSEVDVDVKKPLLIDILKLIGITDRDGYLAQQHLQTTRKKSPSTSSLISKPTPCTRKAPPHHHPATVGEFTKIFPYSSSTDLPDAVKVGSVPAKRVVGDVRRRFFV